MCKTVLPEVTSREARRGLRSSGGLGENVRRDTAEAGGEGHQVWGRWPDAIERSG